MSTRKIILEQGQSPGAILTASLWCAAIWYLGTNLYM